MKKYEASDIRNLAFVGHKGSGKTSLAEAYLFDGKTTTRLGGVDSRRRPSISNRKRWIAG